jgi:hypothetical protein
MRERAAGFAAHHTQLAQAQAAMAQYAGQYEELFATTLQAQAHVGRWSVGHREAFVDAFVSPSPPSVPPALGEEWVEAAAEADTLTPQQRVRQQEWAHLPPAVLLARILGGSGPEEGAVATTQTPAPLQCISIIKRRRKKMNKHKWRKRRRAVRNSTRYNKERKSGESRTKME